MNPKVLRGKKSHRSNPSGNCVRVGRLGGSVVVWNDADEIAGHPRSIVVLAESEWTTFVKGVKDGEFDNLQELPQN